MKLPVEVLIDTGATHTFININVLPVNTIALSAERGILTYADGRSSPILGSSVVSVIVGKSCWKGKVYFVDNVPFSGILGMDILTGLHSSINVKKRVLKVRSESRTEKIPLFLAATVALTSSAKDSPELCDSTANHVDQQQQLKFDEFLGRWVDKFTDSPGRTNVVKHKIYLQPGTGPIKQRYYPMSPQKLKIIHQHVDDLIEKDHIEASNSPWSSPALLVAKKNNEHRMVVDYRKLNKVSIPCAFPLPYMRDIFSKLKDAYYLSGLDLLSGFHQIEVEDGTRELTAFTVPGKGLFHFKVMPFGLSNAPTTFQNAMEIILRPVLGKFVYVYLDDILVYSKSFEEHLVHLEEVFNLLLAAGLKLNWTKCSFLKPYVDYLGHIIGQGEIRVSGKKVSAIAEIVAPKTVKQVRSFLGMVNFYRPFIRDCSLISTPLTDLLKKDKKFVWNAVEQLAFDSLKEKLMSPPVLCCPDFSKPMEIHVDASLVGLGAVLVQKIGKREQVIAYASRTLSKAERNYSTTERECLAVLFGAEHFREYVDGQHFMIITDHASLMWLQNIKNPAGRLARWVMRLSQFNFTIKHRKGSDMVVPDALSRAPYNILPVDPEEVAEAEGLTVSACIFDTPDAPDFSTIQDAWYSDLRTKILEHPDHYPKFRVANQKVYKTNRNATTGRDVEKIVVPSDFRQQLLEQFHSSPTGGHFGTKKTLAKLQHRYYWPNMHLTVRRFVVSCRDCQQYKSSNQPPQGLMSDYSRMFLPGTAYSVDLIGPLPRSKKMNKYIVSFVDVATKWLVAVPIRAATSAAVSAVFIREIILQYGSPELILVDNGSQFISAHFKDVCKKFGVKIHYTPKYFPAANMVERYHYTLKTRLAIFAQESHQLWDQYLDFVVFSQRTAKNDATGFSPALLTLGRELRSPYELYANTENSDREEFDASVFYNRLKLDLLKIQEIAVLNMDRARKRQAHGYNLRRKDSTFEVDQLVWKKNFQPSSAIDHITQKLSPKFVGPYRIVEVLAPSQVRLEDLNNKDCGRWHVNHLKHVI